MFIKEENLLNSKSDSLLAMNHFYTDDELYLQERLYALKNFVVTLEDKTSWSWTKIASVTPVWGKGFCVSGDRTIFYNEVYFINNVLKHSFFHKGLSSASIVKEELFKKKFSINLESFILPRSIFQYQVKNFSYNYMRPRPYAGFLAEFKLETSQFIKLERNFLSTSFSADKFKIVNFFRINRFSKKNKIFLLTLYERIRRRILLTQAGVKKKIRRRSFLRGRYKLIKNAVLKRLKKNKLPFFNKLAKLRKRFIARRGAVIKSRFSKKKIFFSRLKLFYSGSRKFKRKISRKNVMKLKKFNKNKTVRMHSALVSSFSSRILTSVFSRRKYMKKKKIGYFFKKIIV